MTHKALTHHMRTHVRKRKHDIPRLLDTIAVLVWEMALEVVICVAVIVGMIGFLLLLIKLHPLPHNNIHVPRQDAVTPDSQGYHPTFSNTENPNDLSRRSPYLSSSVRN